jgi:hypothetical protein
MKLPWIARSAHVEMMALVTTQIAELTAERRVLLDRLATLGLGGPLFTTVPVAEDSVEEEPAEIDELEKLMNLRRRPSKLADALTRKAYRDYHRAPTGPSVQWISSALDQAEATGKIQP